jgi:hypothetical protein
MMILVGASWTYFVTMRKNSFGHETGREGSLFRFYDSSRFPHTMTTGLVLGVFSPLVAIRVGITNHVLLEYSVFELYNKVEGLGDGGWDIAGLEGVS